MKRAAFVTGGASGIGLSICEHLARSGHSVAVADYNGDGAQDAAKTIRDSGGQAIAVPVDVSDRSQVNQAVAAARGEFGPIEILVTSAAVSRREPFEQMSAESWEQIISVNLTGTFHCVQAVIGDMTEAGWGRVVMISSVAGKNGNPLSSAYCASKHAIEGLSESLRRELMLFGIDVVIVAPGPVKTPIWSKGQQAVDVSRYQNSPYLPALQKASAFMQHLESIGLPPERIAERVFEALTLPQPKVRYQITPDPMRHLMMTMLPKRMVDKIIAKRLGLLPPPA